MKIYDVANIVNMADSVFIIHTLSVVYEKAISKLGVAFVHS